MMKRRWIITTLIALVGFNARAQSLHFSQFYNAPQLLNPANTALMPDYDYRIGLNYRTQWGALPVPYKTFSGFADFKVSGRNNSETRSNWLGIGLALYNDKAGDGDLGLFQFQGNLAYHLQFNEFTMLSMGVTGSTAQRSIDYDKLTFDAQWDGFTFNPHMTNGEKVGVLKTNYYTVGAGLNFSYYPSEAVYTKLGASVVNLNQPSESFYGNAKNTIAYRPIVNLDMLFRTGPVLIVNPSVYYTQQKGASELVVGSLFRTVLNAKNQMPAQLILGAFDRLGDAAIGVVGLQIGPVQFMGSYDMTMSSLSPYNASYGALEFSLIYQSLYHPDQGVKKAYSCPRFF